jgi:hypothetical protein
MTTYIRSWFTTRISAAETGTPPSDSESPFPIVSPPSDEEPGSDTETEQHDDSPPAFPSLSSAQRMQPSTPTALTDAQRMPPPLLPVAQRNLGTSSTLAVPLTTTKRPSKKREKVALAPGHSPLDWAKLKGSGQDLRVCLLSYISDVCSRFLGS